VTSSSREEKAKRISVTRVKRFASLKNKEDGVNKDVGRSKMLQKLWVCMFMHVEAKEKKNF
jgi:hypothetical protein